MNTAPEVAPQAVRYLKSGEGKKFDIHGDGTEKEEEQVVTLYMVHPQDVARCKRVAFLGRYVMVGLSLVVLLLSELYYASKCDHDGEGGGDVKCGDRSVWKRMLFYVVYTIIFVFAIPNSPVVLFNLYRRKDNQRMADGAEPQRPVSLWRALVWPTVETDTKIKFYLGGALYTTPIGCPIIVVNVLEANGQLAEWLMLTLFVTAALASFVCLIAGMRTTIGVVWAEPTDMELSLASGAMKKDRGWTVRTVCADGVMAEVPAVGRILRLTPVHYPLPLRLRGYIELESTNTSEDQRDVVLAERIA